MTSNSRTLRRTTLALATVIALGIGSIAGATSITDNTPSVALTQATALRPTDTVTGPLAKSQVLHIVVALKLRNPDALRSFIAGATSSVAVERPVMSPAQLDAQHLPTADQAQAVANYLSSAGFTNVEIADNRMLVSGDAPALTVQKAFRTSLVGVQTADGRSAYANNATAYIPPALQDTVLSVIGLQSVHQAHTLIQSPPGPSATQAVTGHNPTEFASIYGGSGQTTGAGVTVGIITQGSLTNVKNDLNSFTSQNGLATVTTQTVQTGSTSTDTSGDGEWDLDSQDIVGMAGGSVGKIIFYNIPTLANTNLTSDINTAVSRNEAKIINVSLGECETSAQGDGSAAAQDQSFATAVAQGQTFSISTGDSGADECGTGGTTPSWPAASQYVIAVAGTTLNASTTTWSSETVWSGSGGSQSTFEPKPSWQTLWSGARRGVADVAFDADPNSGAKVIVDGASQQIGGTSLAAPLFSGLWSRVIAAKGTAVGFAGPLIYQLPTSSFHDITSGNNNGSTAAAGYDLASGRGSMIISSVLSNIGGSSGGTPTANFTFSTSGLTANFTDTSTDSGGTITGHSWTFGDGGTSTATSPSHTYASGGTYSVTETVTDSGSGKTSSKTSSVTVASTGGTPSANFTFTTSGLTANFTDTSTDSGGTIGSHSWNFGDSATSTATSPSHTYAAAGTYSVTETVTDSVNGTSSSKSSNVTVSTSTSTQLLGNTGFESTASWTASSGVICATGCSGESAHGGSGFAWMDGYGSTHTDTVSQTVTIPSGKSTGTLSFYLHIDTAETTTTTAYDKLTVQVGSTTVATFSNLNKNTGYAVHTYNFAVTPGSSVTVKFTGTEDSSLQTSFVLDDVTLTVQ